MESKHIRLDLTPDRFFREKIKQAKVKMRVQTHSSTDEYLISLLVNFINPPKLATDDHSQDLLNQTLFDILKQAMESDPERKFELLKQLADTSLYISGFFQDYFNRKLFDIDYYMTMGRSAYYHISSLGPSVGKSSDVKVFSRICEDFGTCVDLVAYVSERPEKMNNHDLLVLYNRWSKSNSERLFNILKEAGITPVPSSKMKNCS